MKDTIVMPIRLLIIGAVVLVSSCVQTSSDSDDLKDAEETEAGRLISIENQLNEIEAGLKKISGYRAILDNELQYTRGLDRHDEALIENSYWPDAEASYGERIDMDGFAAWANKEHAKKAAHQHHVTGISVDINGDSAHEEGYVLFSSDMKRDTALDTHGEATPGRVPPETHATLGSGRYLNRYQKRNGQWKMQVHEYVRTLHMRLDAIDLCAVGCLGRWNTSDISYHRPLKHLSGEERRRRIEKGRNPHAPE